MKFSNLIIFYVVFFSTISDASPLRVVLPRNQPGVVFASRQPHNTRQLLFGTNANAGFVPLGIGLLLIGREYPNYHAFKEDFWRTLAGTPYASQFGQNNIRGMRNGFAPFVHKSQYLGENKKYVLHHIKPVYLCPEGLYDLSNLLICSPLFHHGAHWPLYHYGIGEFDREY